MILSILSRPPRVRYGLAEGKKVGFSRSAFFQTLLRQLDLSSSDRDSYWSHHTGSIQDVPQIPTFGAGRGLFSCPSFSLFVEYLKKILSSSPNQDTHSSSQLSVSPQSKFEKAYIVVDEIEKFDPKVFGSSFFAQLLRIEEIVRPTHVYFQLLSL